MSWYTYSQWYWVATIGQQAEAYVNPVRFCTKLLVSICLNLAWNVQVRVEENWRRGIKEGIGTRRLFAARKFARKCVLKKKKSSSASLTVLVHRMPLSYCATPAIDNFAHSPKVVEVARQQRGQACRRGPRTCLSSDRSALDSLYVAELARLAYLKVRERERGVSMHGRSNALQWAQDMERFDDNMSEYQGCARDKGWTSIPDCSSGAYSGLHGLVDKRIRLQVT